jgi:TPR repeat protein
LKHYRSFGYIEYATNTVVILSNSPRIRCLAARPPQRTGVMLAIGIATASISSSIVFAQNAAPAVTTTTSVDDEIRKAQEAFNRKDYASTLAWFRQAADQGNAFAQTKVGMIYLNGLGIAPDYAQAMMWFRKAALQGNAEAQTNISKMYANGLGVARDYAQAMSWIRKAADQGYANAQVIVGSYFDDGRGVAQDYAQAMNWYRKAADQGNAAAEHLLGLMYMSGHGTAPDYARAMTWFRKAADQNYDEAQFAIGVLFLNGLGVARDDAQAMIWFRKAADQGNAAAKTKIAALERQQRPAASASDKNGIPPSVQYRCVFESMPPSNDAKENERRYDACVKANMERLFGSRH